MQHEPIILILDSRDIFDAMSPILSRELGTTHLIHCDNLKAALGVIESDTRVDLILADWDLGGTEFIDAVRHDKETRYTPLIITSNHDGDSMIAMAMRQGASDHLAKPFLEKGLLNVVRRVTKMQERRRKRRLHPDHNIQLRIDLERGGSIQVQLVDFSLECCQTRGNIDLCNQFTIGDDCLIHLHIDAYRIDLAARLIRVEEDPGRDAAPGDVLFTFRFTEQHEERMEKLKQLLDEYDARW